MHGAKYTIRNGQWLVGGTGERTARCRWVGAEAGIALRIAAECNRNRVGTASIWHNAPFQTVSRPTRAFPLVLLPARGGRRRPDWRRSNSPRIARIASTQQAEQTR